MVRHAYPRWTTEMPPGQAGENASRPCRRLSLQIRKETRHAKIFPVHCPRRSSSYTQQKQLCCREKMKNLYTSHCAFISWLNRTCENTQSVWKNIYDTCRKSHLRFHEITIYHRRNGTCGRCVICVFVRATVSVSTSLSISASVFVHACMCLLRIFAAK